MVRVNLLPREVLERRRFEQWYRYVFIGAIGGVLIVLFAYAGLVMMTSQKNDELQSLQEQAQQVQTQADAFGIFETKEQELIAREQVAQTALAGRIDFGMIAEEVSLVLPDEVWLSEISLSEKDGISMAGHTPRSASESMDIAFKSVAKLLVRLNELKSVYDVWLDTATNGTFNAWQSDEQTADTQTAKPIASPVVDFQATGKVLVPVSTPTTGAASSTPATTGK